MEVLELEELLDRNPQVDVAQVKETMEALQELRKRGIPRANYSLVSPFARVTSGKPIEDPRVVKLRTTR